MRRTEKKSFMNNRFNVKTRETRLDELMKLIPEDEFVIVFFYREAETGYQEEDALFNGLVEDWWTEEVACTDMPRMRVLGFQARELETVAGPVIMIVVDF